MDQQSPAVGAFPSISPQIASLDLIGSRIDQVKKLLMSLEIKRNSV